MVIRIVLACLLFVGVALSLPLESRIVNGTTADPGQYPFVVSLRSSSGSHSCGASIINSQWILTAAHCVQYKKPSSISVQYGVSTISSKGPNVATVKKIIWHENYIPTSRYDDDVALLQLEGRLSFNGKTIAAIKLPEQGFEVPGGDIGTLVGWGLEKTGGVVQKDLQQVDLKIYSDEECNERHNGVTSVHQICGGVDEGGKGQCSGDSGGPLVYKGVQVGIVSWSRKPCTIAPYPGVYTKVSHYIDWIMDKINE
ncbi:mite allergen Der p 3 [Episyrphus balteatus]|uniref:mite allergen Der p 3 n=1 Tax=Episyrphus balteatus TaxID=286459 RepID=UPI002486A685|nr:mite allergen Der p 3 [Episyrphus balteatus]